MLNAQMASSEEGCEIVHERVMPRVFCRKIAIRTYQNFCRVKKNGLGNEAFIMHLGFIQYNFAIQQKFRISMLKHKPY